MTDKITLKAEDLELFDGDYVSSEEAALVNVLYQTFPAIAGSCSPRDVLDKLRQDAALYQGLVNYLLVEGVTA